MPQRWLHNLLDIITHGKYLGDGWWKYHKWKDEISQQLGVKHRILRHDDYKKIIEKLKTKGVSIEVNDPYELLKSLHRIPEDIKFNKTELIGLAHEAIDYVWSSLPREQKLGWVNAYRDVILNPSNYFKNRLLEPDDLDLPEFKKLQEHIKSKEIDELI